MSKFANRILFGVFAVAILFSATVHAQSLLLHFPLEAANEGGATLYAKDGGSAVSVPGKVGSALRFDGKATIAVPFNLSHAQHPKVTVTAWVKQEEGATGTRTVFSHGGGGGIAMIAGQTITMRTGSRGLTYDGGKIPLDEWVFVAAVLDTDAGFARLHQNDGVPTVLDGLTGTPNAPRKLSNPANPDAEKKPYVFVGAMDFRTWQATARPLSIDEVRVYAGVLSVKEIAAIRDGDARRTVSQLPDDIENPEIGLPTGAPEPKYDSPEAAEEAARQRDEAARERSEAEDVQDQQQALESGKPRPVGEPTFTVVAGYTGENQRAVDFETKFLHEIGWKQRNTVPCAIGISSVEVVDGAAGLGTLVQELGCDDRIVGDKVSRYVKLFPNVVTALQVCNANNTRLKGIRIRGANIRADGSLQYVPAADEAHYSNCKEYTSPMLCPNNWATTGIIVHSADRSGGEKEMIVGLQLICRAISVE